MCWGFVVRTGVCVGGGLLFNFFWIRLDVLFSGEKRDNETSRLVLIGGPLMDVLPGATVEIEPAGIEEIEALSRFSGFPLH